MRYLVINFYAERVIGHAALNCESCPWGFVKDLGNGAAQVAAFMRITHKDINNQSKGHSGPGPTQM
jgi:hypothetical protein